MNLFEVFFFTNMQLVILALALIPKKTLIVSTSTCCNNL